MNAKKAAAERATGFLEDGMVVGLGTGSTAFWAIEKIGEKIRNGMRLQAVASSEQTEQLAMERNIPIIPFRELKTIDITIDGADEVDQNRNLIKGGGGALLREKIIAFHSTLYVVIVDESKMVKQLGRFPLPVEIAPFAAEMTLHRLQNIFGQAALRKTPEGKPFQTDNGNFIADLHCYPITQPDHLNSALQQLPGVLETGLFLCNMVDWIVIGSANGEVKLEKGGKTN